MLSLDYEFLEGPVTVLIGKLKPSGAALAYTCMAKGPGDAWVVKQFVRDMEAWGLKDVCLKTDGEPAMLAMQEAIARARSSKTIPQILRPIILRAMAPLRRLSRTLQVSYAG